MASKIPRANASSASSSSTGNQQSTPLQEGAMKRPAAAIDPDMEPEVIEWDDPEVLDFDVSERPSVTTVFISSEANPADSISSGSNPWAEIVGPDDTDIPEVDYSFMRTRQDTGSNDGTSATPQIDTGASHTVGPQGTESTFRPAIQRIPRLQRLSNVGR